VRRVAEAAVVGSTGTIGAAAGGSGVESPAPGGGRGVGASGPGAAAGAGGVGAGAPGAVAGRPSASGDSSGGAVDVVTFAPVPTNMGRRSASVSPCPRT